MSGAEIAGIIVSILGTLAFIAFILILLIRRRRMLRAFSFSSTSYTEGPAFPSSGSRRRARAPIPDATEGAASGRLRLSSWYPRAGAALRRFSERSWTVGRASSAFNWPSISIPGSRRTRTDSMTAPDMTQVERGPIGPQLNAFGPGEHLPPVGGSGAEAGRGNNSSDFVVSDEDPFWDPSDLLPPATFGRDSSDEEQRDVEKDLFGSFTSDPFADPNAGPILQRDVEMGQSSPLLHARSNSYGQSISSGSNYSSGNSSYGSTSGSELARAIGLTNPAATRFTNDRELGAIPEAEGDKESVSSTSTVKQVPVEQGRELSWLPFSPAAPSTHVSQMSMPMVAPMGDFTDDEVPNLGNGGVGRNRLSSASSVSMHAPSVASGELGAAM